MRTPIFVLALLPLLASGCALLRGIGDYSFADEDAPAQPQASSLPEAGTTTGDASTSVSGDADTTTQPQCRTHHDCAALGGVDDGSTPAVCIKSTGTCATLLTPDCPRFVGDPTNDDAIVIGAIVHDDADGGDLLESAVFMAAQEIDGDGGGLPGADGGGARPLVVVGCNTNDVLASAHHLAVDLRVPAIVGPLQGQAVVDVTQQVSVNAGTLVMAPTSTISSLTDLSDDGLTWRALPSDAQRAKLVIEQVNELETLLRAARDTTSVKLGVIQATDANGASARDAITGKLILNGHFITDAANAANVSIDAYAIGDADALAGIATKYAATFQPDIVFITAADQIGGLVVKLERALTVARATKHPYYVVTEAAKTDELLTAIATGALPTDTPRRVRGVGAKSDATSAPVLDAFSTAYAARFGASLPREVTSSAARAYDATYAIAYALVAKSDQPATGKTVAFGLRSLSIGDSVVVGAASEPSIAMALSQNKSVTLHGTFAPLSWDSSGDVAAGTLDVWCIGTGSGAPLFGSSGLTMDVGTQVIGGAYLQCQ